MAFDVTVVAAQDGWSTTTTAGQTSVVINLTTTADVPAGASILVYLPIVRQPVYGSDRSNKRWSNTAVTDSAGNTYLWGSVQPKFNDEYFTTAGTAPYFPRSAFIANNVTALPSGGTVTVTLTLSASPAPAAAETQFNGAFRVVSAEDCGYIAAGSIFSEGPFNGSGNCAGEAVSVNWNGTAPHNGRRLIIHSNCAVSGDSDDAGVSPYPLGTVTMGKPSGFSDLFEISYVCTDYGTTTAYRDRIQMRVSYGTVHNLRDTSSFSVTNTSSNCGTGTASPLSDYLSHGYPVYSGTYLYSDVHTLDVSAIYTRGMTSAFIWRGKGGTGTQGSPRARLERYMIGTDGKLAYSSVFPTTGLPCGAIPLPDGRFALLSTNPVLGTGSPTPTHRYMNFVGDTVMATTSFASTTLIPFSGAQCQDRFGRIFMAYYEELISSGIVLQRLYPSLRFYSLYGLTGVDITTSQVPKLSLEAMPDGFFHLFYTKTNGKIGEARFGNLPNASDAITDFTAAEITDGTQVSAVLGKKKQFFVAAYNGEWKIIPGTLSGSGSFSYGTPVSMGILDGIDQAGSLGKLPDGGYFFAYPNTDGDVSIKYCSQLDSAGEGDWVS